MSESTVQPLFVSATDAAKLLSISKRSLWRLVSQGQIHRIKFGKRLVRFRTDELAKLMTSQPETGAIL